MAKENRRYLVGAFEQRVEDANELLKDIRKIDDAITLNVIYGGILSDEEIMTKQGTFRKNASRLNMEQLKHRISLLDSFLKNAEKEIKSYNAYIKEIARRLGVKVENANKVLSLMEYAKQKVGDGVLDSYQVRDIINARVEAGQTMSEIKRAFNNAVESSMQDIDKFFTTFSENGTLL